MLRVTDGDAPKRGRSVYINTISKKLHQVKKLVEDFQGCNGEGQRG